MQYSDSYADMIGCLQPWPSQWIHPVMKSQYDGIVERLRILECEIYLEEVDDKHTFEEYTSFLLHHHLTTSLLEWGEQFFSFIYLLIYHLNVRSVMLSQANWPWIEASEIMTRITILSSFKESF